MIEVSNKKKTYTKDGRISSYAVVMKHAGLNEVKELKSKDNSALNAKIEAQVESWNVKWRKVEAARHKAEMLAAGAAEAEQLHAEAVAQLQALDAILLESLSVDHRFDWDSLKNKDTFPEPHPKDQLSRHITPSLHQPPGPPDIDRYKPVLGFLDKLFDSRRKEREYEAVQRYEEDCRAWDEALAANAAIDRANQQKIDAWQKSKDAYEEEQRGFNQSVDALKAAYERGEPEAIQENFELALNHSHFSCEIDRSFELNYLPESRIMVIDFLLPAPNQLPDVKEVKFIASRKAIEEKKLTEAQRNKLYDGVIYMITLRTLHELFAADTINCLEAVSFNGIVDSIDPATGNRSSACIISVQASKEEFLQINLAQVDPKACFKKLKGVCCSKIHSMTPVAPILSIDREDSRFIESRAVAGDLDDSTNLAAMDWEDFEHLIGEIFAKEFNRDGGDVKVTRSSRDAGVDAIAFDPDPIRGGKIVIQAKRYTNTVDVSAVRDLYGTVQAEGANKGILVTTSDFGPDAYRFAQDKPLTLLNGGNLLSIMAKHGHQARIDLKEARLLRV